LRVLGAAPGPGSSVGARAVDGAAVMLLRPSGRGRAAWSGIEDTWRARLEGGSVEAHRAYWSALVDWLAAGRLSGARYAFEPASPAAGDLVRVAGADADSVAGAGGVGAAAPGGISGRGDAGPAVAVVGPGGFRAPAAAPFVVPDTGVYALVDAAGDTLIGTRVEAARTARHAFARAALLAHASGGAALPAPALADWLSARGAPVRDPRAVLAWLVLAAAALALVGAWARRRLRGLP
jgi:hypothetical protein